ncbi:helix-turn-helix domain-containing protein [Pseudomonas plecoglossicida]|nr:helix-turn-helix domain-containing protein [Pseudomonas plecoglossicida]EPB95585.1 Fis family transcriptional regulator [Pseudomonas plecoglossicida NB2011]
MRGVKAWPYPFFSQSGEEMDYQQTLGQLLKELRVSGGLTREACSEVLSRDHLARVEQGKQGITTGKLQALCELLGVSPSMVFYALEARLAGITLQSGKHEWGEQLEELIHTGRLSSEVQSNASRGVRGMRAGETCEAVRKLQADGMAKMQIVRELGVARSTVDRYWLKVSVEP